MTKVLKCRSCAHCRSLLQFTLFTADSISFILWNHSYHFWIKIWNCHSQRACRFWLSSGNIQYRRVYQGIFNPECWFNLLLRRATGDQNTLGRKTISKNLSTDIYLPAKKMLCCYVEKNIEWWQKSHAMDISSKIGRLRKERSLRTAQHELKNKQLQHNPSTLYETSRFTFNHIITMFCDFGFGVRWASS